jgi:cysteine synthase A
MKAFAVERTFTGIVEVHRVRIHPGHRRRIYSSILNRSVIDGVIQVSKEEAFDYTQRLAKEGIMVAYLLAPLWRQWQGCRNSEGPDFHLSNYDTGERYLS